MGGDVVRNWQVLLPLHQRGEAGDVLALRDQPAGIVACSAAEVVRHRFDPALADRDRPKEIDRQSPEKGKALFSRGAFDRPANQRRGRTGVLVIRAPRAAGEGARLKNAFADFDVSCVQGRASPASCRVCGVRGLRHGGAQRKTRETT